MLIGALQTYRGSIHNRSRGTFFKATVRQLAFAGEYRRWVQLATPRRDAHFCRNTNLRYSNLRFCSSAAATGEATGTTKCPGRYG
jgi:hypothetical protein